MNSTEENTMLNLGLKLGENLKKFRLQRELTQAQLADVLGVSAQAVSRWENGTTYPDITLLPTIASYFEITRAYGNGELEERGTAKRIARTA